MSEITVEEIQNFRGRYPKQLWWLFVTEMWERFSFYGMRGMLTVFMVEQLLMSDKIANLKYGAIQAFVYTLAFIGGFFADKILGFRKSIFWGGLLMILGSAILTIDPKEWFFIGMSFTIVGTGFFKPNISSMVGDLYRKDDPRRGAGFSLFYAGINIGALLGGFACIRMADTYGWNAAFSLAGIFMILGLVVFIFTQKTLGPIGRSPLLSTDRLRKLKEYGTYGISLLFIPCILILVQNTEYTDLFMYIVGPCTILYFIIEMFRSTADENKKLIAALILCGFSAVFWAFFEQSGGSLALFARNNLQGDLLGISPSEINNSANSFFVIIFAPLMGILFLYLHKLRLEPNSVAKFGIGFLFLAIAFYVFFSCKHYADAAGITSIYIFTFAYFIITFGELFLSPIGLTLMTTLAPKRLVGAMMGTWFLASAYGQYIAGILGSNMSQADDNASNLEKLNSFTDGYYDLAYYALICGLVMIAISPFRKYLMGSVK